MSNGKDSVAKIAVLAKRTAEELLAKSPELRTTTALKRSVAISGVENNPSVVDLTAAILNDASFGDLRGGYIVHGTGARLIQDHVLPHMLIDWAIQGESVEALIADALSLANSKASAEESYTPVAGITLAEKVTLVAGFELIPWSDVPNSPQKTKFSDSTPRPAMLSDFPRFIATPTAALRRHSPERQILFLPPLSREGMQDEMRASTEAIDDAVRCITALAVGPVAALGGWTQLTSIFAN